VENNMEQINLEADRPANFDANEPLSKLLGMVVTLNPVAERETLWSMRQYAQNANICVQTGTRALSRLMALAHGGNADEIDKKDLHDLLWLIEALSDLSIGLGEVASAADLALD
jgi:hypothetical protein